jgi:hypothetical protein
MTMFATTPSYEIWNIILITMCSHRLPVAVASPRSRFHEGR